MMKVLFCGKQFNSGFEFTRDEILKRNLPIMVTSCYPDDLLKEVADAFVIIPFMCRIDRAVFEVAKELRMVMQYGVGLEGVDIESASEKRVWVCNIQSENCGNAQSCAEHALFLSFCLMRKLIEMKESISRGRIGNPTGETLFRSRVMLLGYGGIGRQLLRRLIPFDPVEIIVVMRRIDLNFLQSLQLVCSDSVTTIVQVSFDEFISSATGTYAVDTVFLCCTQNYQTLGLVNHIFLSKFAYPVNIINVARVSYPHLNPTSLHVVSGVGWLTKCERYRRRHGKRWKNQRLSH